MTAGDLITDDWQAEYSGILMGPGTAFGIKQFDFADMPVLRSSHSSRGNDQGNYRGSDYMDNRYVTLTMIISGTDQNDLAANIVALQSVTAPANTDTPLVYKFPGQPKQQFTARPYKRSIPLVNTRSQFTTVDATLQFLCLDPRIYSYDIFTQSTNLPYSIGGRDYPLSFPFSYGYVGNINGFIATNSGSFETRPTFVIQGPVLNPVITNNTTGKYIAFDIELSATDVLEIDTLESSVLLNGEVSRRNTVTVGSAILSTMNFIPGDNSINFNAASYDVNALLTATWRNATV